MAEVQAALVVHSPLPDRFDANEPVVVAKWRMSNRELRQQVPWLAGSAVVRVFPDDRVVETFGGNTRLSGG
ncbi:MAG: hypothetical protein WCP30_03115 [Mycobacteriaceae bacterium]